MSASRPPTALERRSCRSDTNQTANIRAAPTIAPILKSVDTENLLLVAFLVLLPQCAGWRPNCV